MITPEVLEQFKARMRITHNSEDSNLQELLSFSVAYVKAKCGDFDFENEQAKEIVFERTRFAYNDALEYFEDSFMSEINSLGFEMAMKEVLPDAPTV